jgi:hypothetical protein
MKLTVFIATVALSVGGTDGFKFMSNWQPPKILTDAQKVEIAKTEERFGNKSELSKLVDCGGVGARGGVAAISMLCAMFICRVRLELNVLCYVLLTHPFASILQSL